MDINANISILFLMYMTMCNMMQNDVLCVTRSEVHFAIQIRNHTLKVRGFHVVKIPQCAHGFRVKSVQAFQPAGPGL